MKQQKNYNSLKSSILVFSMTLCFVNMGIAQKKTVKPSDNPLSKENIEAVLSQAYEMYKN